MNKNPIFWLFVLNIFLVLLGYALSIFSGGEMLPQIMTVKAIVLVISTMYLVNIPYVILREILLTYRPYAVFSLLLLYTCMYAQDSLYSLQRTLLFVGPMAYLYGTIYYLVDRYSLEVFEQYWLLILLVIYSIPLATIPFLEGNFSIFNLYYIRSTSSTTLSFVSNQYGWASCMVVTTGLSILLYVNKISTLYRYPLYFLVGGAMYILFASGNRTSWIVFIGVLLLLFLKRSLLFFWQKCVLIGLSLGLVIWFWSEPSSVLYQRWAKTYMQWEQGESRFLRLEEAWQYGSEHWMVWLHGWGMFSAPTELLPNLHNSYAEIFFGAGIPAFLYFLYWFAVKPFYKEWKCNGSLLFPLMPILIIPFFESNLTVGQFLFYPWLGTLLFLQIREGYK